MDRTSRDCKTVEPMVCEDVFDSLDNTIEEAERILNHANDLFLFLPDIQGRHMKRGKCSAKLSTGSKQ